jgi:thiol-disulfide isomerase/thioredoxin
MSKQPALSPRLIVLIALLILAVLLLIFSPFIAPEWPKAGDSAPNLNAFPVEGTMPNATNRVVLLDFWASWCSPCKLSMPIIDELNRRYSPRGLLVIGVSVDTEKADMDDFLKQHPVSFTIVRDSFTHLADAYNAHALPRTFVIGANGKIIGAHTGFSPAGSENEYVQEIEAALSAAGK